MSTKEIAADIIAEIFHDNDTPTPVYTGPPAVPDPNAPRSLSKQEKQKLLRAAYREQQRAPRQFWDPLYRRWFWG